MPDPNDQTTPVPGIQAEQLAHAADNIYAALQAITLNVQGLQAILRSEGGLELLKDRSERMEINVQTLQQTMNLVVDAVTDPRIREKEFLGSLLQALLDVGDTLDTVKEALGGLAQQIQGTKEACTCAWRDYLTGEEPGVGNAIFDDLVQIARLAPRLDIFVRDAIGQRGYDPDTGKKREWLLVQIDRVKSSFGNVVINLITVLILAGSLYVYQYAADHGQMLKFQQQQQAEREQNASQLTNMTQQNQDLLDANQQLRSLLTLAQARQLPRPPVEVLATPDYLPVPSSPARRAHH